MERVAAKTQRKTDEAKAVWENNWGEQVAVVAAKQEATWKMAELEVAELSRVQAIEVIC